MSLKKGLLILTIILVMMTKMKTANGGTKYEGRLKNHPEANHLNYQSFQTRHYNHYSHKKYHKCHLERFYHRPQGHIKKSSRYPTLDKIVDRLDNQIDHHYEKLKMTTSNPFDEWNVTIPNSTTFMDKRNKYSYVTVGLNNSSTTVKSVNKVFIGNHGKSYWPNEDMDIKLAGDLDHVRQRSNGLNNSGFMQDHTTSSPWENEQHDISSIREEGTKDPNNGLTTIPLQGSDLKVEKIPSWPFRRLGSKSTEKEDRKKKTTPMPYIAAHEHYEQVLRLGDCRTPKEKVIKVHEVHPDPSKSYSPSCTILHQCGDDTGCCRDLKQVCKPKNTTKVELYFFITTLGKPQTVEKLNFINHTECECQKRTEEVMQRDSEFRRVNMKKFGNAKGSEERKKKNNCTCPSRYSTRYLQNGTCICDCFDKQDDCLILKRGKVHFSYQDKLCIQQGICFPPSCEFGAYIRQFGRCPNRSEKHYYKWSRALPYRDLIT